MATEEAVRAFLKAAEEEYHKTGTCVNVGLMINTSGADLAAALDALFAERVERAGIMMPEERDVMRKLGAAANAFHDLPVLHPADLSEFVAAIHAAQNIVLARVGLRSMADDV